MNYKFTPKPKPVPTLLQEEELFGNMYDLVKSVEADENTIRYSIFRDQERVVSCSLVISHHIKDTEKSFLNDYSDLDDVIAKSMFRHLKRNILVLQNELQLRRIKLENQIAKEKAMKDKK